jgi:hypothetical protein
MRFNVWVRVRVGEGGADGLDGEAVVGCEFLWRLAEFVAVLDGFYGDAGTAYGRRSVDLVGSDLYFRAVLPVHVRLRSEGTPSHDGSDEWVRWKPSGAAVRGIANPLVTTKP